jgi:putative transposase
MQTSLINESIAMAARNYDLRPGCIFHSDRGTQYTSQILWNKLAELNLVSPMGRTGVLG